METVYTGARVICIDADRPEAQAFRVRDGRFVAVGTRDDAMRGAGPKVREVDLQGRTVVPGFIDAHLHILPLYHADSVFEMPDLGPAEVADMEALIRRMQQRAQVVPPGQWLLGRSYQETKLGRHPTRFDLDRISTVHPIRLYHASFHVSAYNTLALENAGITKDTPDPPGGSFDRDENGELMGIAREGAQKLVTPFSTSDARYDASTSEMGVGLNPPPLMPGPDEWVRGMVQRFEAFAARGITSVGIAGIGPRDLDRLNMAKTAGNPVRVYAMFYDHHLRDAEQTVQEHGWGDDRLRLGAVKVFHGHSLSGLTAWVSGEYPGRRNYFGIQPKRTQQELDDLVAKIQQRGFQAAIHANGDREIEMVLTAFERAAKLASAGKIRHRIEHASITNESILTRARDAGVTLVFHSYMFEHGDKISVFGPERLAMMHPHRTALDMGVHVAGHSDWPVSAADPLLRIQDLVTRAGQEGTVYGGNQRITVAEALQVMTAGGAYASQEDDIKGSISVGKLADFVVLGEDPRDVPPQKIKNISVVATYVGGEIAWQAKELTT